MTIVIQTLQGNFEYPPRTLSYLLKTKWDSSKVGGVANTVITTNEDADSEDAWYSGQPPEILVRTVTATSEELSNIGDTMFRCEYQMSIHIFSIDRKQNFLFQNEIRRILKEWRRAPILKYGDSNQDSGWRFIYPSSPKFQAGEDSQDPYDTSESHQVGYVTAVWYEFRT